MPIRAWVVKPGGLVGSGVRDVPNEPLSSSGKADRNMQKPREKCMPSDQNSIK